MSTHTVEMIIRGYHVYQTVWEAAVGLVLPCQQERGNVHDPYAVAVDTGSTKFTLFEMVTSYYIIEMAGRPAGCVRTCTRTRAEQSANIYYMYMYLYM